MPKRERRFYPTRLEAFQRSEPAIPANVAGRIVSNPRRPRLVLMRKLVAWAVAAV